MEKSNQCKEEKFVAKGQILEEIFKGWKIQIGRAGCYVLIVIAGMCRIFYRNEGKKWARAHFFLGALA